MVVGSVQINSCGAEFMFMWAVLIIQKYNWPEMGMGSSTAKHHWRYHKAFAHCSVLTFSKKMENSARLDFLPHLIISV